MTVSRRAFLMIGAGAVAAKVLAPLMPAAPEPLDFSAKAFGATGAVDAQTGLFVSQTVDLTHIYVADRRLFDVGDVIMIGGDKRVYRITSMTHGGSFQVIGELLPPVPEMMDVAIPVRAKSPRTYPKHFRAKQRDPWFSFAS